MRPGLGWGPGGGREAEAAIGGHVGGPRRRRQPPLACGLGSCGASVARDPGFGERGLGVRGLRSQGARCLGGAGSGAASRPRDLGAVPSGAGKLHPGVGRPAAQPPRSRVYFTVRLRSGAGGGFPLARPTCRLLTKIMRPFLPSPTQHFIHSVLTS